MIRDLITYSGVYSWQCSGDSMECLASNVGQNHARPEPCLSYYSSSFTKKDLFVWGLNQQCSKITFSVWGTMRDVRD